MRYYKPLFGQRRTPQVWLHTTPRAMDDCLDVVLVLVKKNFYSFYSYYGKSFSMRTNKEAPVTAATCAMKAWTPRVS